MTPQDYERLYPGFLRLTPQQQAFIKQRIDQEQAQKQQQKAQQTQGAGTVGTQLGLNALTNSGGSSIAGEAVGTAANGGTLFADGAGGATTTAPASGLAYLGIPAGIYTGAQQAAGFQKAASGQKMEDSEKAATFFVDGGFTALANSLGIGVRKNTKQVQAGKRNEAVKNEVTGAKDLYGSYNPNNQGGRVDDYAAPDFVGITDKGWVNNKYATSRNVADLQAEDVWGDPTLVNFYGNDWLGKASESQRRAAATALLQNNLLTPSKGGFNITDEAKAKAIFEDTLSGKIAPMENKFPNPQQQAGVAPTGGGGFSMVINQPAAQKVDPREGIRAGLLDKMLTQNQQPVNWPSYSQGTAQESSQQFTSALNRIIGG